MAPLLPADRTTFIAFHHSMIVFPFFFIMVLSLRVKQESVERGLRLCLHFIIFFAGFDACIGVRVVRPLGGLSP